MVIIGIDPHKRTHTASALRPEPHTVAATLQVDASLAGYRQLMRRAATFPQRRWAVENVRGLGRHLAQWLVARGETVDDVPCTVGRPALSGQRNWSYFMLHAAGSGTRRGLLAESGIRVPNGAESDCSGARCTVQCPRVLS